MIILTIDLGTSATKAALWDESGLVALSHTSLTTTHPRPGWAEQNPDEWWNALVDACMQLRDEAADMYRRVAVVAFSAARETFALFDARLQALGPGILWSDTRATEEARALGDPVEFRARTGVVAGAGACAAKLAWAAQHRAQDLRAARWILTPKDVAIARLTGEVVTDTTLASRTGLVALTSPDVWTAEARAIYADRLPPIVTPSTVVGTPTAAAVKQLALAPTVAVVAGAGDRACEVLGTGASDVAPMVSWGTTANVSVPHSDAAPRAPQVAQLSQGALSGLVVEAGLSAAGAALGWLVGVTGWTHDQLLDAASAVPPGAAGVLSFPWFAGARAPWWQPRAHASFVGLTAGHGPGEMARAIIEGVAFDVARCVELVAPATIRIMLTGGGAALDPWPTVAAGVCARPVVRRAVTEAGSVGARLVAAAACGEDVDADVVNPVVGIDEPAPELVAAYQEVRARADGAAAALLELAGGPERAGT